MPDNSISTRERQACFGPPEPSGDDLMCRADGATSGASPSRPTNAPAPPPKPTSSDYETRSWSLNLPLMSISVSRTTDRFGQDYWGLGGSAGASAAPLLSLSTVARNHAP